MTTASATIFDLLDESDTSIAVVGATDDPSKYGHRIYRDLKAKGFTVYPVNRWRDTVDGDTAYPRLADLPASPDIVNIVVPPDQSLDVVRQVEDLGLDNVWLQPGAEDGAVIEHLAGSDLNHLVQTCIMVRSRPLDR